MSTLRPVLPSPASLPRCPTCQSEYADAILYCPRDGALLLPTVLEGRYRLLSQVGAGGMGVVYLAEHVGLQKRVAVKVLKAELSRDPTFARRFELEAIAASQMGHENIVDVTDLGRTPGGELYYVMELLEGSSLSTLLYRERFVPLPRAVPILVQVCRALEAAHARGIVHRDIKPQNVMVLAREGRPDFVKVVDFGISKVDALQGGRLTEAGAILGTADYMAPEQATGGEVDARADVYALGVLIYELVTGVLPFRGDNTFATMLQHVERAPEPPSVRRPELGLPPELDALVLQALAKDPAARPSMSRLRAGLEALPPGRAPIPLTRTVVAGQEEAAAPPRTTARAAAAQDRTGTDTGREVDGDAAAHAPTVVKAPTGAQVPVRASSRRLVWGGGAGAALLLVVGAAVVGMRETGERASPSPPQAPAPAAPVGDTAVRPPPSAPRAQEPVPQRFVFASAPPGATVLQGEQVLGVTPLEVARPVDAAGPWRFTLEGHAPLEVERLPEGARLEVVLKKQPVPRLRTSPARRGPAQDRSPDKVQDLKPNPFR
jgi:eukaryotic-like serine/threonine-protein kinase